MFGALQLAGGLIEPYVTIAEHSAGEVLAVTFGGQKIVGAIMSDLVKLQMVHPVAVPKALTGLICQ